MAAGSVLRGDPVRPGALAMEHGFVPLLLATLFVIGSVCFASSGLLRRGKSTLLSASFLPDHLVGDVGCFGVGAQDGVALTPVALSTVLLGGIAWPSLVSHY